MHGQRNIKVLISVRMHYKADKIEGKIFS